MSNQDILTFILVISCTYGIYLCFLIARSESLRVKMAREAKAAGLPMNISEVWEKEFSMKREELTRKYQQ